MVILIDFIGVLVIFALCYQGYVEGLQFKPSLMLAALCGVVIFTIFFSQIYLFVMHFIPYPVISGPLTVIFLNSIGIFAFYKAFVLLLAVLEKRFFIPQISNRNKKIGGIIIGTCVGYIFIAGMVTSLEQSIFYTKHRHTKLTKSVFYKAPNVHGEFNKTPRKIDNIPALRELYSEANVKHFSFTEEELVSILKMIREISNSQAKEILEKVNANESMASIYIHLINTYSGNKEISKKYFVAPENIEALRIKILPFTPQNITRANKKQSTSINDIIEKNTL